jgi:Holliday junction resolvase
MKKKPNEVTVTKASGERAHFSEQKLRASLRHAGATPEQIDGIVDEIEGRLYQGISTKKIYKLAFNLLKDTSPHLAGRYHLKQAIMELGPSGYPFERFIAEILRHQGFAVKVGVTVQGKCVQHEIDVIAERDQQHYMVECKYHNRQGVVCDVKIPLYIHARFQDVESQWVKLPNQSFKFHQGWLVTNTKFTTDAIQYGTCAGLNLLGWNYPPGASLKDQIDKLGLYPLTALTSITDAEKRHLLDHKVVLCREIWEHPGHLKHFKMEASREERVLEECRLLCEKLFKHSLL